MEKVLLTAIWVIFIGRLSDYEHQQLKLNPKKLLIREALIGMLITGILFSRIKKL